MPDAAAAVIALRIAGARARDLDDDVVAAIDRARALCHETRWQASAAAAFHEAVRAWCAELVAVRGDLADLEAETDWAAARLEHAAEAASAGASL